MKVLLIQPPIEDFYDTSIRLQPIGLSYIKASLLKEHKGIEVKIIDFHRNYGRQTIAIPKELEYLKPYYQYHDKSAFSTFHQYYHFGAKYSEIKKVIEGEDADVIGISSLFTPYYREVLKTAEAARNVSSAKIVIGGSHVSAFPELMLKHPAVDFTISGEAEKSFCDLISAIKNNNEKPTIPGVGYKVNCEMVLNGKSDSLPMNELPIPDMNDYSINDYLYENKPLSFVITSRSCPHKCSFCSVHVTFGERYSRRDPKLVLEELKLRYDQGYRVFDFEDDNLSFYRKEMHELLDGIDVLFPKRDVQFLAMNGISYLSLDKDLLIKMKKVGFTNLNLALVSSDKSVLESTKRPHTVEKYQEIVHIGSELGFDMVTYQIIGLPNESLESMIQTLAFNAQQPVLLGASLYYQAPTQFSLEHDRLRSEKDLFCSRLTAMYSESDQCKRNDMYTLFITTRILNFFKSLEIVKDTNIDELLENKIFEAVLQNNINILKELHQKGVLYADTPKGLIEREHFNVNLYKTVINKIKKIPTQNEKLILLK